MHSTDVCAKRLLKDPIRSSPCLLLFVYNQFKKLACASQLALSIRKEESKQKMRLLMRLLTCLETPKVQAYMWKTKLEN
jgi:hypothetical protein